MCEGVDGPSVLKTPKHCRRYRCDDSVRTTPFPSESGGSWSAWNDALALSMIAAANQFERRRRILYERAVQELASLGTPTIDTGLYSIIQASVDTVVKLLDLGATVNAVEKRRQTPLHRACERGRTDVVRWATPSVRARTLSIESEISTGTF